MAENTFNVVRELLDNQVSDREGRPMGNIDGLRMEIREGEPPRITHLELGGTAMVAELSWPFGPVLTWMARRWGHDKGEPWRVPWSRVLKMDVRVQVDESAEDSPALHWERVLRERVVRRIPGA